LNLYFNAWSGFDTYIL